MRVVAFLYLLLQATLTFYDDEWKRTAWLFTAVGVGLALLVMARADR